MDRHLSAPEPRLRAAIDALAAANGGWLGAADWQTLISFITSIFVRTPEFATRFESRLGPEVTALLSSDNTTMARVIEQQRLFAPVMYANWIAARADGESVPTNDLGYFLTKDLPSGRWGYGVPLAKDLMVALFPGAAAHTLRWSDGRWLIDIPLVKFSAHDVADMSRYIGRTALSEVYGPTQDAVVAARIGFSEESGPMHGWGPGLLVPSSRALRDHEHAYMHLLSLIAEPPRDDASELVMGWPPDMKWESRAAAS